jgi:hypothetical protein
MTYTNDMRTAVHSLDHHKPEGFGLDIFDNDMFITLRIDEKMFFNLVDTDKRRAIEYVMKVKDALEYNGAVVLVVRKAI